MTATTNPARCAGADDGEIFSQVRRRHRTSVAVASFASFANDSRNCANVHATAASTPDAKPDTDWSRLQLGLDQRTRQSAFQSDHHQPRARQRVVGGQRADQLQRLRQRVRLGRLLFGRHPRPQGDHFQPVATGRHRLHPIGRKRIQRNQRADRRLRVTLRFNRLGFLTAVLRCRHHPDAVRKGEL